tara:strand:- start:244 stop:495 length:252 start_codon:yes stop_codon:yes gene_type:complete
VTQHGKKNKDLYSTVNIFSNRETATLVVPGQADAASGTRGVAAEFGLNFINLDWKVLILPLDGMCISGRFFRNFWSSYECQKS